MKLVHRTHLLLVFCLVSSVFSYALFLKCYFPLKQGLSGHARAEDVPGEPVTGRNGVPSPVYNRLVLMVVDALRTDFVLGDIPFMPYTRRLLHDGLGVAFSAKTHLPTVTLPRIKAMTSGSIPGFVDVVLNVGSSALTDDNLLRQLKLAGKTLTFFGDDTWLRLFPDHFARADGTTSFFVTDYTEVDVNVSRHLAGELGGENGDWDMMVLHYLGLDHLGHLYAPEPSLFTPKLREMDAVVQQIFSALTSWDGGKSPALLVLTGDHGVSNQGGHGGASPEETGVPIVLLSPHTTFQPPSGERLELQQIDLCPTLSALLGLPIPVNNLGRVEVTAMPVDTPLQDRVRHLQLNAAQMLGVLEQNVGSLQNDPAYHLYQDVLSAHTSWLSSRNSSTAASWEAVGTRVLMGYQDAVRRMSLRIGQTSTRYDMYGIGVAIVCLWMNLFIQGLVLMSDDHPAAPSLHWQTTGSLGIMLPVFLVAILSHVTLCTSQHRSDILCGTSFVGLFMQLATLVILLVSLAVVGRLLPVAWAGFCQRGRQRWSGVEMALAGSVAVHTVSLLSSSYVEEEHQTWYFLLSSFHAFLLLFRFLPLSLSRLDLVSGGPAAATTSKVASSSSLHGHGLGSAGAGSDMSGSGGGRLSEVDARGMMVEADGGGTEGCDGVPVREREKDGSWQTSQQGGVPLALSLIGILVLCRILRRWNQTGNKWLDVPDVGDWLVRPENKPALSLSVAVSLWCLALTRVGSLADRTKQWLLVAALICVYLSKAAPGSLMLPGIIGACVSSQGVVEARLAYIFILCLTVHCLKWPHSTVSANRNRAHHAPSPPSSASGNISSSAPASNLTGGTFPSHHKDVSESRLHQQNPDNCDVPYSSAEDNCGVSPARAMHRGLWEGVQGAWLCVMCLLLRPHNAAQVAMVSVVERLAGDYVLPSLSMRPSCVWLYCLMMGQAAYFFQGNSNSLATVDVSAGLTALFDYQPVIIGIQITMATYAGLVFWLLSSFKYIALCPGAFRWRLLYQAYTAQCGAALATRALPLAVYTVLVTAMRHHLFVWTVFSPKLLYEGTLTLVLLPFCVGALLLAHRAAVRNIGDKEKE